MFVHNLDLDLTHTLHIKILLATPRLIIIKVALLSSLSLISSHDQNSSLSPPSLLSSYNQSSSLSTPSLVTSHDPVRLVSITAFHPFSDNSSPMLQNCPPPLFTRKSILPNSSRACFTICMTCKLETGTFNSLDHV